MPLIALSQGVRINSLSLTDDQWIQLRTKAGKEHLIMPGCGTPAIARASKLGFRHFSHKPGVDCTVDHKPESVQHLAMKATIAQLIDEADGWTATIEKYGPDNSWIADVLAEHVDGRRIAFEVQLSGQSALSYSYRSQRYFDDGVLPVWVTPFDKIPSVILPWIATKWRKSVPLPDDLSVLRQWPSPYLGQTLEMDVREFLGPQYRWSEESPLQQLLAKDLETLEYARREAQRIVSSLPLEMSRRIPANDPVPVPSMQVDALYAVWVTNIRCYRCGAGLIIWQAQKSSALHFEQTTTETRFETDPAVDLIVERWAHMVRPASSKAVFKKVFSKTAGKEYVAFICRECSAMQGHFFLSLMNLNHWTAISKLPSSAPLLPDSLIWQFSKYEALRKMMLNGGIEPEEATPNYTM